MVITEAYLRSHLTRTGNRAFSIREQDIITPAARDFAREHRLVPAQTDRYQLMGRSPVHREQGYVDTAGNRYTEKPEHMTHLHGNLLVPKTHPRIRFRGRLDSLQAAVLQTQFVAQSRGEGETAEALAEILAFARELLASEVKEEPLCLQVLLGMSAQELRTVSHDPRAHIGVDHLLPHVNMGELALALNALRTNVRECELAAADALVAEDGRVERPDLLQALNRLSSAVYILYCRILAQRSNTEGDCP